MPGPYASAGIFGGIILLGTLIWKFFESNREEQGHGNYSSSNSSYDIPRNHDWGNDDGPRGGGEARPRGMAVCHGCKESLVNAQMIMFTICKHIYHDKCISNGKSVQGVCEKCASALEVHQNLHFYEFTPL